jgi:hypothetical protein
MEDTDFRTPGLRRGTLGKWLLHITRYSTGHDLSEERAYCAPGSGRFRSGEVDLGPRSALDGCENFGRYTECPKKKSIKNSVNSNRQL